MGCSREGFNLLTESGRYHFKRSRYKWHNRRLIFEDTFMPLVCGLIGHRIYDSNREGDRVYGPPEWACKRCHRYVDNPFADKTEAQ